MYTDKKTTMRRNIAIPAWLKSTNLKMDRFTAGKNVIPRISTVTNGVMRWQMYIFKVKLKNDLSLVKAKNKKMESVFTVKSTTKELVLVDQFGDEHVSDTIPYRRVMMGDILIGTLNGRKWKDCLIIANRSDSAVAATIFSILKYTRGRRGNLNKITVSQFLLELGKGQKDEFKLDRLMTSNAQECTNPAFAQLTDVERRSLIRGWKKYYCHRFNSLGIKNREINQACRRANSSFSQIYDRILSEPYLVPDLSVEKADQLAIASGNIDNVKRLWAVISHLLNKIYQENGWTYVPVETIDSCLSQYMPEEVTRYPKLVEVSKAYPNDELVIVTESYMRLKWIDRMETELAAYLVECNNALNQNVDIVDQIMEFEIANDFTFQPEQVDAINNIVNRGVTLINGEAGTGKTTLLQMGCKFLSSYFNNTEIIIPVSFTGKAARRMEEGENGMPMAMTIHSFMSRYKKHKNNSNVILIVDEVSMVDSELCHELCMFVKSLYGCVRLVFVGDIEQLPPINRSSFVSAYIDSGLPVITLEKNQRTNNVILENAHIVIGKPVHNDFANHPRDNTTGLIKNDDFEILSGNIFNFFNWINANKTYVKSAQVLSPYNKVCDELNSKVRSQINPGEEGDFRKNDIVIQTKNYYSDDYELLYDPHTGRLTGCDGYRVVNGEVGHVTHVAFDSVRCKMSGDEKIYKIPKTKYVDMDDDPFAPDETVGELATNLLRHRYCLTIHKSQGSEHNCGIIFVPKGMSPILTRNLLYTAITRFKKKLKIIGDLPTIKTMINTPTPRPLEMLSSMIREKLI